MALVGYSDSESSDADDSNTAQNTPALSTNSSELTLSKPAFQKVVDRSKPHRIRVNLPTTSSVETDADEKLDTEALPRKQSRTGGAFSDFNSLLSAPKNTNKSVLSLNTSPSGSRPGRSRVPGAGVNLKTGIAPSFSRDPEAGQETIASHANSEFELENCANDSSHSHLVSQQINAPEEVKIVGKATIFKPLSVSRKSVKRKKQKVESAVEMPTKAAAEVVTKTQDVLLPKVDVKPKKSLFSSFEDDFDTPAAPRAADHDTSFTVHDRSKAAELQRTAPTEYTPSPESQKQTLSSLAASLDLTPSQRRQLFGRNTKDVGQLSDAQISHFSLAAEYSNNNVLRENDSAVPGHNPIRSIASGKHSLQQLVNMASNQKDALEESFATGKANKKSAGSRYGW